MIYRKDNGRNRFLSTKILKGFIKTLSKGGSLATIL